MDKDKDKFGRGYVQVYTGNGKGKTTAALGLAFRALGFGLKIYIGQFLKGQYYSEIKSAELYKEYIKMEQYGKESFVYKKDNPDKEDIIMAQKGLEKARAAMYSGLYNIVIFDEINMANYYGLISVEEMIEIIETKPPMVEIVFTGRNAPKQVIEAADLVTEIVEIKHYYEKGVPARVGIER